MTVCSSCADVAGGFFCNVNLPPGGGGGGGGGAEDDVGAVGFRSLGIEG